MTRKYSKIINRKQKKSDEIIDLTDTSGHNHMPAIRELETNPVTGCVTIRCITDQGNSRESAFNDDTPIHFVEESKGSAFSEMPNHLQEQDGNFEEKLEAEGAFIIDSTTHYPASKRTITKRSQKPAESGATNV